MKSESVRWLSAATIVIVWTMTTAYAAPPLPIGADLRLYKKPARKACTAIVPVQYPTVQAAIDAVVAGSTVCVNAGTYNENVHVTKSIRLSGSGFAEPSTITPPELFYGVYIDADDVVVEGFVINGIGSNYWSSALLLGENRTSITVRSNRIVSSSFSDVVIAYGLSNNHLFQNNVLVGDNSPQMVAINGAPCCGKPSNGMTFINNTFIGTVGVTAREDSGFVLLSQATSNVIQRNIFDATGARTLVGCSYAANLINQNNFNSDTTLLTKVWAGHDGTTNAENNWWGDTDPSDDVAGGVIDYDPFALVPFKQNRNP